MSYKYNTPSNTPCYYVDLNTYTKGKFGKTDFTPPLCQPIVNMTISYKMPNYASLYHPMTPFASEEKYKYLEKPLLCSYPYMNTAYNLSDCSVCSPSNCQ